MKNVLIIGLGAVGCAVASRFVDAGYSISALCDKERKRRYEKNNFIINGKKYTFDYVTPESYGKIADLVLVVTKYHSLKDAICELDKVIGENTVVFSMLNGIDSEQIIGEQVGMEKVMYGYTYKNDATKVGNTCNFASKEIIAFGEKNGEVTKRVKMMMEIFEKANISYELSQDILTSQWWKYMMNIGYNQVSCVLKATYSTFQNCKATRDIADLAMGEAIKVANAEGINLVKEDIAKAHQAVLGLAGEGKTSMLQDMEAKRKTEVEMFAQTLCQIAEKHGIDTPVNQALLYQIKTLEYLYDK